MSERDYLMDLYDIYKDLLTDKQREYFQNYYFEDLTLQEASDELNVSKQIISKTILQVTNKLKKYESTLHLNKIYNVLTVIRETTTDENIKKELDKLLLSCKIKVDIKGMCLLF